MPFISLSSLYDGRKTTNRLRAIKTELLAARQGACGEGRKTTNRLRAIKTPPLDLMAGLRCVGS